MPYITLTRAGKSARIIALSLLFLLLVFNSAALATSNRQSAPPVAVRPDALQRLSAQEGYLLAGGRLYRTATGGVDWDDATPPEGAVIASHFLDARTGWAVLAPQAAAVHDPQSLHLLTTDDGGRTWMVLTADLPRRATDGMIAEVWPFFVNSADGWLVWRFAGSSNFREGALFRTRDGGATWTRLDIPIGEPVRFADALHGWTAGGPAGDALYETADGGAAWTRVNVPVPAGVGLDARPQCGLPATIGNTALLPVSWVAGDDATEAFYRPTTAGQDWRLAATDASLMAKLGGEALIAHEGMIWALAGGQTPELRGEGTLAAVAPGSDAAWLVDTEGVCADGMCRQEMQLLGSTDGGRTWTPLPWPAGVTTAPAPVEQPVSSLLTIQSTELFIGHGFDKCEIPTSSQLAMWATESPYRAVNLYMGGVSRACSNAALNASYLRTLRGQGWVFIPTWVGPQAPCTSLSHKMSADPAVAYEQGLAEGSAALARAVALELAEPDGSGTVIYYDLEYFSASNSACLLATQAFITGWTERVKAAGSQAGVYSTGCVLNGQAGNVPPPDAIWAANWIQPYGFNPDASVWDVYCLSNTLWMNHQRLRQYTGGHNETWGGVTLNIDSNVLDGPVALPCGVPGSTPTPTAAATATATATRTATATVTATNTATSLPSRLWLPLLHK
jgi:photosystem II stability/assembly factor-like uncharacterized protein